MESINTKGLLALATTLLLMFGALSSQAVTNIDVRQAQSMNLQGALILDVREPQEFAEAHAPNAILIPLGELGARLQEIDAYKNKPVAIMCRSGRRSGIAAGLLEKAGYTDVSNVSGGILAWKKAGLEEIRKH